MDFKILAALLTTTVAVPTFGAETTNAPAAAIYDTQSGMRSRAPFGPQLIVACWANGRIIWSATNAGPPYLQGQIAPAKLTTLLQQLERKGVFTDTNISRAWFGPDASFTTITLNNGSRNLRLSSWHELFERRTNLVAAATGIRSLSPGETRESALENQPENYKKFRETWSEIKKALIDFIPSEGQPYTGKINLP